MSICKLFCKPYSAVADPSLENLFSYTFHSRSSYRNRRTLEESDTFDSTSGDLSAEDMPPRCCKFQYNWRITSLLEKVESRGNFYSPNFITAYQGREFKWSLCLKKYTDTDRILPGYYGMYLEFQGPNNSSANLSATFYFLSDSGETLQSMTVDRHNFNSSDSSHGIGYYIRLNKVRQLLCRDGSANFHITLLIDEADFRSSTAICPGSPQRSRYRSRSETRNESATCALLSKILAGEDRYSDIGITSSDGITFYCHKAILSENEIFFRNFETDTRDARHNHIALSDIPSIVLRELLRYLYIGKVQNLPEVAQGLLYAAEKYMLHTLKEICEDELVRHLTAENATTLLLIADSVRATSLKERCISVVLAERKNIISSNQWNQVLTRHDLINEILLNVNEKAIFLGVTENDNQ